MSGTPTVPSPEQLALLAQTLRDVAQARRLSREDAEDFAQSVQVRFLERGYDIFGRFEGRSSLRTYLTVVITRMLLDWRNSKYGKWRPSKAAVSLGEHAVDLERLVSRDGYTTEEAAEVLRMKRNAPSLPALRRLAEQLPARQRRRMVSDEPLRDAEGPRFEDPIEIEDRSRAERRVRAALAGALRQLSPEDRWLIQLRYVRDHSVRSAGLALGTDPKALYRRYERVLRKMRGLLTAAGVTGHRTIA
jgi:RNA polymerase sigma factor for flagellar operon FliA